MRSADMKLGTSDWSARERTPLFIFRITETSDWSGVTQPPFRPAESLGDVSGRPRLSGSLGEVVWQEDLQEMIGSAGRAATRVGGTVFSKAWIGGRRRPPSFSWPLPSAKSLSPSPAHRCLCSTAGGWESRLPGWHFPERRKSNRLRPHWRGAGGWSWNA